jgi:multimeric flavodoxin WrbA
METIKILGIVGSAKKDGNTAKLVSKALEGAETVPGIATELFELAGKNIAHCLACFKCMEKGECVIRDDLDILTQKYMDADGILWGSPVYVMSVPGIMKSALDRLGNVVLGRFMSERGEVPRFNKVCGVIGNGGSPHGGQELVLNFLIDLCLGMNGIVISGDTQLGSLIGAAACSGLDPTSKDSVLKDEEGLNCAKNLGKRVAETTKIFKAGKSALEKELPKEYFYTWGGLT